MRLNVYAIYDKKTEEYSMPFLSTKEQVAIRDFSNIVNMHNSIIKESVEDFDLFLVGTYDTESAHFDNIANSFICNAASVLRKE